jgi:hypothetical protein
MVTFSGFQMNIHMDVTFSDFRDVVGVATQIVCQPPYLLNLFFCFRIARETLIKWAFYKR